MNFQKQIGWMVLLVVLVSKYLKMRIYYLMNPELGWDSVCSLGKTFRAMAINYYEDEDLSDLTDIEIESKIIKENLAWNDRELKE